MRNFLDPAMCMRLWNWCMPEPNSGCWLWIGKRNSRDYGQAYYERRHWNAHRLTYTLLVGEIPAGLQLDHLCRNPSCVNPAHLEPVTARENTLRSEGFPAKLAKVTHCPYGHEYTPDNIVWNHGTQRTCRECHRRRGRETHAKKRARMGAVLAMRKRVECRVERLLREMSFAHNQRGSGGE